MPRQAIQVTITGDKDLQNRLKEYGKRGVAAAMKGVKVTAVEILLDAKQRLQSGGHRVTGMLFNSGKVLIDSEDDKFLDVVFSGGGVESTDYAEYVEFGRRAGRMPPLGAITEWVVKQGLADSYNAKSRKRAKRDAEFNYRAMSIAFLIAKKIAKQGTKAHPFLYPAFEAKQNSLTANIEKELQKLNDSL